MPVWYGSMLETNVGRAANLALASLPNFALPGDISASRRYYHEDVAFLNFELNPDSTVSEPRAPGLGVAVDRARLASGGMYSTPPPEGGWLRFADLARHAVLPVWSLVLVSVGPYMYAVRTITLNIAQEDFVSMARARGLSETRVRDAHILRVAAPPIVTGLIFGLAGSLSGSILIETVFNWQGMGRLYYDALAGTPDEGGRDRGASCWTFMFTLMYVAIRLLLETLYIFLDPRVSYAD